MAATVIMWAGGKDWLLDTAVRSVIYIGIGRPR
jgi:hypothetical protein